MADQRPSNPSPRQETITLAADIAAGDALGAIKSQGLLGSGRANIIDLTPIRERLGAHWEPRREHVWDYAERFLRKRMSPRDILVRLDEVSLLLSQPEMSAAGAQARCVRAAGELVGSLIGSGNRFASYLKTADRLDGMELVCSSVDVRDLQSALAASNPGDKGAGAGAGAGASASTLMLSRSGRNLRVDVGLQPLWDLRSSPHRLVGSYAHRTLNDGDTGMEVSAGERGQLVPTDFAAIDQAALSQALKLRSASADPRSALIIPASYLTIANSNARNLLFRRVKDLSEIEQKSFSWEITDTPDGLPESRLVEILAFVRQICRSVICHLPLTAANAQRLKRVGATISSGSNRHPFTEYELFQLQPHAVEVSRILPGILLRNVPAELVTIAAFAHATHANLVDVAA